MINHNVFNQTEARSVVNQLPPFSVVEYQKDLSVSPSTAQTAYFMSQMNIRRRQVVATLNQQGIILQAGAMQMIVGNVQMNTNVQGAGDLFKKFIGSKVTKESAIKPRYFGTGQVILEPTFKYIILEDLAKWNGSMVIEDGLFLACTDSVQMKVTARSSSHPQWQAARDFSIRRSTVRVLSYWKAMYRQKNCWCSISSMIPSR